MLLLPNPPQQYDQTDQAVCRRSAEAEDKKNVKIGVRFAFVPELPTYAKAALPAQTIGGMIYVTDDVGGAVPAFSDGTNWRRVTDRAVIA